MEAKYCPLVLSLVLLCSSHPVDQERLYRGTHVLSPEGSQYQLNTFSSPELLNKERERK